MYYDNYVRLCNAVKKSPSAVALEIGIAKPTVSRWKSGSKPNSATLIKVADYFKVDISELTKEKPTFISESGPTGTKYDLLTPEHRKVVDSLIEQLLDAQSHQ